MDQKEEFNDDVCFYSQRNQKRQERKLTIVFLAMPIHMYGREDPDLLVKLQRGYVHHLLHSHSNGLITLTIIFPVL